MFSQHVYCPLWTASAHLHTILTTLGSRPSIGNNNQKKNSYHYYDFVHLIKYITLLHSWLIYSNRLQLNHFESNSLDRISLPEELLSMILVVTHCYSICIINFFNILWRFIPRLIFAEIFNLRLYQDKYVQKGFDHARSGVICKFKSNNHHYYYDGVGDDKCLCTVGSPLS